MYAQISYNFSFTYGEKCQNVNVYQWLINLTFKMKSIKVLKKDISERCSIPTSPFSTILNNRENIIMHNLNIIKVKGPSNLSDRRQMKMYVYEEVNDSVPKWITSIRNNNLPIYINKKTSNLLCSKTWFCRFLC